jgi:rod shape-determining protein MreD
MMASRPGYFVIFVALLVLLHFTLHLAFGLGTEAPDLLTVAALIAARRVRGGAAAGIGFALGLLDDSLSLNAFGASAIALTVVCYLGARSRDLFEGESVLFLLVYLFLGKWLRDVLVTLASPGTARPEGAASLLVGLPLYALYAAVAGVVAMVIYRAISGERA